MTRTKRARRQGFGVVDGKAQDCRKMTCDEVTEMVKVIDPWASALAEGMGDKIAGLIVATGVMPSLPQQYVNVIAGVVARLIVDLGPETSEIWSYITASRAREADRAATK